MESTPSCRKQLAGNILEGLELERVAGRVHKKHRGLLTCLALEPRARLDHKLDPVSPQMLRQLSPLLRAQNNAAMRHGYALAIDGIEVAGQFPGAAEIGIQMADELMAVEVEIHPIRRAAALHTS